MKFTSAHITGFLLLAGLTSLATCVKAQESRPFPEPDIIIIKENKAEHTVSEPESNTISTVRPQRDSAHVILLKPIVKPSKFGEKAGKEKQEDPLSFNFLYYIIEKFKLSDIIE